MKSLKHTNNAISIIMITLGAICIVILVSSALTWWSNDPYAGVKFSGGELSSRLCYWYRANCNVDRIDELERRLGVPVCDYILRDGLTKKQIRAFRSLYGLPSWRFKSLECKRTVDPICLDELSLGSPTSSCEAPFDPNESDREDSWPVAFKPAPGISSPPPDAKHIGDGLTYIVLKPGTGGVHPRVGDIASVHLAVWDRYTAEFMGSTILGHPGVVPITEDMLNAADTKLLTSMTKGEKRRFWMFDKVSEVELVDIAVTPLSTYSLATWARPATPAWSTEPETDAVKPRAAP